MAELNFTLILSEEVKNKVSPHKAKLLGAISSGLSNKLIAESFGISLKAVEQAFSELNKSFGAKDSLYNSRLRIVSSLLAENLLNFETQSAYSEVPALNKALRQTLLLTAIGLSSQTTARLLSVSIKTIEQRLAQLYDYFGVDTRKMNTENPRIVLLIRAMLKGNIAKALIQRLHRETSIDRLKRILEQPEYFVEKLSRNHNLIG